MLKSHQKAFENDSCQKITRLAQKKKNFTLHCIQVGPKDKRKKSDTIQEIPVECSNDSEASEEEHPLVE